MKSNLERIQDLEEREEARNADKRLASLEWDRNVAFRKIEDLAGDVGLLILAVIGIGGGLVVGAVACFWFGT